MRLIVIQLLLLATAVAQDTNYRMGSWRGRNVAYRVVNGLAIAEGDILLENVGEVEGVVGSSKDPHRDATGTSVDALRWTNRTVPYLIDTAVPNPKRITDAIQHWNDNSIIKMIARTDEKNYVRFIRDNTSGTCSSFVGMLGGEQRIVTADTCVAGSLIHELGHAVGLNHEQSRIDRDGFVKINWDAIDKRFFHDFDQAINGNADYGLYDYGSIMHYPAGGFEITSMLSSLETVPRGIPVGQRDGLSPGDLFAVKRMYAEPVTATVVTTFPVGLDMIVDGAHVTSPKSFDWAPGSTHTVDVTPQQGTSRVRYVFGRWTDGGDQSHTVTASADIGVIEAAFVRQFFVGKDPFPGNGGTVTFDPPSDDGFYADGTPVTVTAQPAAGFYFVGWSLIPGSLHGLVDNPAQTRITGNWDYGPFFDTVPLNIVLDSTPGHRLVSFDLAMHSALYGDTFKTGSAHTLATGTQLGPSGVARYTLTGWSDNGTATHSVTATDTPVTYTAGFRTDYLVSLTIDGPTGTTIERIPASADGFYESGTQVQLIPHPAPGFQFVNWSGDATGIGQSPNVTVDGQKAVTAVFRATGSTPFNGILNAATMQPGYGAPGELLLVNGTQGAPDGSVVGQPSATGALPTTLANSGVAFDGRLGPVVSVNGNQVTSMIPFSSAGKSGVAVFIVYSGKSNTFSTVELVSAVPGIFTVDGSGFGAAKVVNADGSDNAAATPAARGTTIAFRGTGFGKMTPAIGDNVVVGDNPPSPELPVSVTIGGVDATVVSALAVKGSLGGLVEVTVQVPDGAPSGVVPLALKVGTQVARQHVTVALQ